MRPTIDQTLMAVAQAWALRGTCSRLQVGAVLAQDDRTIASGYNGSPAGADHCSHEPESSERCTVAVHAETNVIGYAARAGARTEGAALYVTHAPCEHCAPVVIAAGIERVVFAEPYGSGSGIKRLEAAGVLVQRLGMTIGDWVALRGHDNITGVIRSTTFDTPNFGRLFLVDWGDMGGTGEPEEPTGLVPLRTREDPERLSNPDPDRRITLNESMTVIGERYGNAIDELGRS